MLNKVLEIGKESYKQEKERSDRLFTKSDNLIKYIFSLLVFMNALLLAFNSTTIIPKLLFIIIYSVNSLSILTSLLFCIHCQSLKDLKLFPYGKTVLEDINNSYLQGNEIPNSQEMLNEQIIYYSDATESVVEFNNKCAKSLRIAYSMFFISVVLIVISTCVLVTFSSMKEVKNMAEQNTKSNQSQKQQPNDNTVRTAPFKTTTTSSLRAVTEGFSFDWESTTNNNQ